MAEALSQQLRAFQDGRLSEDDTRAAVSNILVDVEPKMVEEFISVHMSSFYRAWTALPQESLPWLQQPEIDERISDLEGGLELPPEIQRRASSQSSASTHVTKQKTIFPRTNRSTAARGSSEASNTASRGTVEWQAIARSLIPEGSASYATWFTIANVALIVGVFAYMAGDYAMWMKEHPEEMAGSTSSAAPAPADLVRADLVRADRQ